MPVLVDAKTVRKVKSTDSTHTQFSAKTVLFNDEWHTFQEVAEQLVKAIRCSYSKGLALANVVHATGSAIVYSGPKERCEAVAMVLEDIGLKANVES